MITYKDCYGCGTRRIHASVPLCEVCETAHKAFTEGFRSGAEEMRLACQQWCRAWENDGEAIADALADLRVEDKP